MVVFPLVFLALALLVARVGADHAHHALAANDAAVLANATNGTTYFHVVYSTFVVERTNIISKIRTPDKGVNSKIKEKNPGERTISRRSTVAPSGSSAGKGQGERQG